MKKRAKKRGSLLLAAAMVLSLLAGVAPLTAQAAPAFSSVGGWNETIYATISDISDGDVTAVSYSGPVSGSLTGDDFTYLVRGTTGGVRLDIPGLKAGTYSLTVETTSGTVTQSGIQVDAQDRSGFAHYNYSQGVGAYNDDGTLKDNAIVLYVTNANKNSVVLSSSDGTTVTGIGHILNSAGREATAGSGLTSQGGTANNNQGILRKIAEDGHPLVIRIIGNVTCPDGVTAPMSVNFGGIKDDSGYMVRMQSCKNITIEGIGASAVVNGWGFSFIASSGDSAAGLGRNFEVRNLTFNNVPEDCIGLEGQQSGDTLPDPIERCWVHHNTFVGPVIENAAASDKKNGDGACDWKRGLWYTNCYNHYDGYRKTNLVGSNDDCLQYHATFHHNYWNDCAARAPLARQADVHMYNNIWYSMIDYCISPRASSYVFYEYGYFVDNGDVLETSGDTDGFGNVFENNKSQPSSEASNKASAIASSPLAGTYVESGDYSLQTDIAEMKATVYGQAGAQRATGAGSLDPDAPEDPNQPGGSTAGGYVHNFTAHGLENEFFTITGTLSTSKGKVTYNGLTLTQCLVMSTTTASVSFDAPASGTLTMVFGGSTSDKNNTVLLDGTAQTINENNQLVVPVSAGAHKVVKDDTVHLWYMAYVPDEEIEEHTHTYTAKVTAPTCEEQGYTTYTCSCGSKYVADYVAATGHNYENGSCTVCGKEDPASHVHSYTAVVTAPTCEKQGYTTHTCSCGDSYTDSYVTALGHDYKSVVTAPTCTAQGYTTYTCDTCGKSYKDNYVAATGHHYENGVCTGCGRSEAASSGILAAAGHLESAYVTWAPVDGATGYNVYVKKSGGAYAQLDDELIRQYPDYMRADAVGLAAGSYTLKIVPLVNGTARNDLALETDSLTVLAHDRSGFAHSGGYVVGAYNNDGTLKDNAVVFYITKDTVNTVSITENGDTYTGLGKLVKEYARTTSHPIVIRIIGEIGVPSATTNGQIEVKGNIVPITIEGIGADATCNRWGFKLSSCENVEVRNLGFMNNDSSEGDSMTLQYAVRSWVHNCDFFYGEPGSDADQVKGDGALDTKHSQYVTHSYNHFWDCGKVNLQGSGSSDTSNNITYHHNWYDHSDSRHPRVRIASVHVYNNYYDGNAGYGVGAACHGDVFVENNYFRNCMYPMMISDQGSDTTETMSGEPGGMIKAFGNVIVGETSFIPYTDGATGFDAYVASSRDEQVPGSVTATNGGAGYNNFDTASDFYSYTPDSPQDATAKVVAYSGRVGGGDFQWVFDDSVDDGSEDVNAALKSALLSYETTLVSVGGNSVETPPEEHTHTYTVTEEVPSTCIAAGHITYACSCGDTYTENLALAEHSYSGEFTIDVEATATTDGSKSRHCTTEGCTAKTDITVIPATGEPDPVKNGLIREDDGKFYYYVDGVVDTEFVGLVANNFGSWYVKDGYIQFGYNSANDGQVSFEGNLYEIRGGSVNTNFNGIAKRDGIWYYFQNGVVDTAYAGLVNKNGTLYYVRDGKIDFSKTGVVEQDGKLYYVKHGSVSFGFNGLVKDDTGRWIYVEKSVFNPEFTGLAKNDVGWWYVQNGVIDTSFTGLCENFAGTWYVKHGQIIFTFTGVVHYEGSYWYCKSGMVQTDYVGLASYNGGLWYIENGKINFDYSGTYTYNGVTYNIKYGQVV